MPLVSGLPIQSVAPWSNTIPDPINQLFTLWDLSEKDALLSDPTPSLAWCMRGTKLRSGISRVTYVHAMPEHGQFRPFDGTRVYNKLGAVARAVEPTPRDLSFGMPMVHLDGDTGWRLMTVVDGNSMVDVLGATGAGLGGIPRTYVFAGKVEQALEVANLFHTSMYCAAHGMTSPTKFTHAQPNNPDGIALFTDGTGAEGSGGAMHYTNPTNKASARFANVFAAYGSFFDTFGDSIAKMIEVPNALFPSVPANSTVTDVFGPSHMRKKFWENMIRTLSPQVFTDVTGIAAAATTNPYSMEAALKAAGIDETNFTGRPFGPKTYWIASQLDDHPYCAENPGKDMWINLCDGGSGTAGDDLSWAKGACNNETCTPVFRFYGPGDPKAQRERMARFEGDLDLRYEPGSGAKIAVFFEA